MTSTKARQEGGSAQDPSTKTMASRTFDVKFPYGTQLTFGSLIFAAGENGELKMLSLGTMGSREGPSAMKHRIGSAAVNSWKRLKVAGKMRRQEQEAMGRDVLSGTGFISIAGDSMTIHFTRKRAFLFQQPAQSERGIEEPKGGEFKRF
jgi:hypothetical protein